MSKTFDLSTLNLSAGTHSITVKARASGYTDSEPSIAVSYVVAGEEISFTIDGTTYYAEEGMTWGEWVDSEYNTGGFYVGISLGWQNVIVNGETGTNSDGHIAMKAVRRNNKLISSDDTIQNEIYEFRVPSTHAGGGND